MSEKRMNTRIINKHSIEADWLKATNFIPKQGEIIVYDIDDTYNYERFKIGDGKTVVSSLPFADETKVDKVSGKGLSTNDYTTAEKNKLAGIATGANKTTVDSSMSTSSTNPVQNKVVTAAINELNTLVGDATVSEQISEAIDSKVDKVSGKGLSTNDYTTTEKNKLAGIASGAEVNQNAFSNVTVGSTTIAADAKTDTLTIAAGSNVTITPDATNDKITIAATDTVYTHPTYTSKTSGLYKVTVDGTGHVSGTAAVAKSDITALGIPAQDTTYSAATTGAAGLMSAADKTKLNGIATGANKTTVDSALSSTSTNPVQNKVVNSAISSLNTLVGDKSVSEQISTAIADKADADHTHTAAEVGADASGAAASALSSAKSYTDTKISDLINSAPTTLDTLGEIATAMEENADVVAALETAVGTKANASDLTSHTGNTSNPHGVTKAQVGLGNVENKSSATIRGELTKANVTTALGYTPPTTNTTYSVATQSADGLMSAADKKTLDALEGYVGDSSVSSQISEAIASKADSSHTHSAYVNQNAFSNVKVGTTTVAADSTTDTLTLVAGSNVTITPDATNDKITIAATDTVYTHPSYTARTGVPAANATPGFGGTFNVSQPVSDATGHITAINSRTITIPSATATTSVAGLMSAADKTKLDGIATGANKITVDSALSSTSTNPVQNKVINTAINNLNTLVGDTAVSEQISSAMDDAITGLSVSGKTVTYTKGDGSTGTITTQDTNTTYTANNGVSLSGTTFSNSGVRSVATGSTNGTISVNTNGTSADVAVKGLGSAAYTASTAYDAAGAADTALTNAKSYTDSEITEWVGDTAVATQIANAVANKVDQADFDALEIGGRNLIRYSAEMKGDTWDQNGTAGKTYVEIEKNLGVYGYLLEYSDLTADRYTQINYTYVPEVPFIANDEYTVSLGYYIDSSKTPLDGRIATRVRFYTADDTQTGSTLDVNVELADQVKDQWAKMVLTFKIPNSDVAKIKLVPYLMRNGNVIFAYPKLERGNMATDWTPAIEDLAQASNGITTAGDGSAYTATVPGITALTSGVSFIMLPHVVSASTTPTLNVNGLGAKNLKRRLSSIATGVQAGYTTTWLAKGLPFRVTYDGTQWIVEGQNKPAAADLYGTLAVNKGGTGATDAATALTNLGAVNIAGDTMTGPLTINTSSYPAYKYQVGGLSKTQLISSASASDKPGGLIIRGYSADGSAYKDLAIKYANDMRIPADNMPADNAYLKACSSSATVSAGSKIWLTTSIANSSLLETTIDGHRAVFTASSGAITAIVYDGPEDRFLFYGLDVTVGSDGLSINIDSIRKIELDVGTASTLSCTSVTLGQIFMHTTVA